MDREVPEIAGREDDDNLPASTPYDHYLTELIGLLRHGGGEEEDGSGVVDGEIKTLSPPAAPRRHGQSTWTTTSAATSSGDQMMELPAGSAVVVGAGEAEMASWLRQDLQEGAASDRPDQPAAVAATYMSGGRHIGSSLNYRSVASGTPTDGAVAAAGKRPVKEQYYCPGCCRPPRSAGKRSGASRAAEQRRRDKINEKLRTLQRLAPRSNKSDKASTLDGVIQHIKYLQHQLQVYIYLQQPAGGGVVFGCRPPPPLLHHHHQHRPVPAPIRTCSHGHHGNGVAAATTATAVVSSPHLHHPGIYDGTIDRYPKAI